MLDPEITFLKLDEVAPRLRISDRTLLRLIEADRLRVVRPSPNTTRIASVDLDSYIEFVSQFGRQKPVVLLKLRHATTREILVERRRFERVPPKGTTFAVDGVEYESADFPEFESHSDGEWRAVLAVRRVKEDA